MLLYCIYNVSTDHILGILYKIFGYTFSFFPFLSTTYCPTGADPGVLERGFAVCIKAWGLALLILSPFSLKMGGMEGGGGSSEPL